MNKDNLIEFAKEKCEIFPEDSYMGEYLRETLKMLQAEPCEDTISRQAAIDAINKAFERVFVWDGTSPLGDKVLENVPSAQPEQRWIPFKTRPLTKAEKEEPQESEE